MEDGWSGVAFWYLNALLETRQFQKARQLIDDPEFSSLFDYAGNRYIECWYQYYSGDYREAGRIMEEIPISLHYDRGVVYAQQKDKEKVDSILSKYHLEPAQKALIYGILQERDSMYYYLNLEKDIYTIFHINGSIELDPYRKEERYKAFLEKNHLPLTTRKEE